MLRKQHIRQRLCVYLLLNDRRSKHHVGSRHRHCYEVCVVEVQAAIADFVPMRRRAMTMPPSVSSSAGCVSVAAAVAEVGGCGCGCGG